jgi:nocturnin
MDYKNSLCLMQWNTLSRSEFFCSKTSFPFVDEKYLSWSFRKELFMSTFDKIIPDVICLQEVDEYDEFKTIILSQEKYESKYYKKNEGIQGIAIFYDKQKFNLLTHTSVNLPKDDLGNSSNQFFVVLFLREKVSNKTICLISTHLKAKAEFENIRLSQMKFLLNYIDYNQEFLELFYKHSTAGIIFCGDLNAEPTYSCINYIKSFKFENNQFMIGKEFKSAYNFWDKDRDDYTEVTTFKIRDTVYYRVIDYIFYTDSIISESTTPTFKLSDPKFINTDFETTGLPCGWFPSDHYYLTMKFYL